MLVETKFAGISSNKFIFDSKIKNNSFVSLYLKCWSSLKDFQFEGEITFGIWKFLSRDKNHKQFYIMVNGKSHILLSKTKKNLIILIKYFNEILGFRVR